MTAGHIAVTCSLTLGKYLTSLGYNSSHVNWVNEYLHLSIMRVKAVSPCQAPTSAWQIGSPHTLCSLKEKLTKVCCIKPIYI